jgi:hypothetical protein
MYSMSQRPCGLYRTTVPIGEAIPAGALVFYHNHGEPGPGVYLPREWRNNRALFHDQGTTVPDAAWVETLVPLAPEGLYRVAEPFACCERECVRFEQDQLLQLGYDGQARTILFVPELVQGALAFPMRGTRVDGSKLARLRPLKVRVAEGAAPSEPPASHLN